jgi:hypothetical protein
MGVECTFFGKAWGYPPRGAISRPQKSTRGGVSLMWARWWSGGASGREVTKEGLRVRPLHSCGRPGWARTRRGGLEVRWVGGLRVARLGGRGGARWGLTGGRARTSMKPQAGVDMNAMRVEFEVMRAATVACVRARAESRRTHIVLQESMHQAPTATTEDEKRVFEEAQALWTTRP